MAWANQRTTVPLGQMCWCGQIHERCAAHAKSKPYDRDAGIGTPCRSRPEEGAQVCHKHGGGSPQAKANAAERRTAAAAEGRAGSLLAECYGEIAEMSGPQQMLDAIVFAGSMARAYRTLLAELPEQATWHWEPDGSEKGADRVNITEQGWVGPDARGQQATHVYEQRALHWTKLHADLLKTAHDMGIAEQEQARRERYATSVGDAIRTLVAGLGRELNDPEVVPLVERSLQIIAGGRTA